MQTPYDFTNQGERIVYVKAVDLADLPNEVQSQMQGDDPLYAVHAENGQQLALVAGRQLAFSLARQNDYRPVAVH
ncbi:MAG: DUF1150 family protein [Paracoccaceae bacterium]